MIAADTARRALAALDLTALDEDGGADAVRSLCARASGPRGAVAAVCIYPRWIATARAALDAAGAGAVRIATVANFPAGAAAPAAAAAECAAALAAGADEVDVVLPWRALKAGDAAVGADLVARCRAACGGALLKVIVESGELGEPALIARAAEIALDGGADFVKTSTGKVACNATPAAVRTLAEVIRDRGGAGGIKVAGGVRDSAAAARYLALVEGLLGAGWARPDRFRFGASGLLDALLASLAGESAPRGGEGY